MKNAEEQELNVFRDCYFRFWYLAMKKAKKNVPEPQQSSSQMFKLFV